jgi:hypothetical protein
MRQSSLSLKFIASVMIVALSARMSALNTSMTESRLGC